LTSSDVVSKMRPTMASSPPPPSLLARLAAAIVPVAALALGAPPARALAPGEPPPTSAAVIAVDIGEAFTAQRRQIEEQLVLGLEASGLTVVAPAESRRRLAGQAALTRCADQAPGDCWRALARAVGARLIGRALITSAPAASVPAGGGGGRAAARRYAITLELDDSRDGQPLARQSLVCRPRDPCPSLAGHVRELARELGRKGRRQLEVKTPMAAALPPGPPPPAALTEAPPPPAHEAPPAPAPGWVRRRLPWLLVGSGLAVAAAGVGLYALDGHGVRCAPPPAGGRDVCQDQLDSKPAGTIAAAAGVALVGAGLGWLWLGPPLRASLPPEVTGVRVSGRF
jgi:hypothetical protein